MLALLAHLTVFELPAFTGLSVLFFLAGITVGVVVFAVTGRGRERP